MVTCATTITFSHPITEDGVRQAIRDVAAAKNLAIDSEIVRLTAIADEANAGGARWGLEVDTTDPASVSSLLDGLVDDLNKRPYFSSLAEVGGQIAGDAQVDAVAALVVSLIGIVLYIWIRFQKVAYGIAAVVALVHDVLLVLGAIAVSKWLAPVLGFVLVDNFKISLPVIAAFLTIIGYSLNDTIVVFDRIREMKGKNPKLTMAMVNGSISQTLSRTVLTSLTTLIVVVILYFIGGEAIHAFAFALMVGIFVGTYSSIFIAAP
ncbi:MAG TPA: protein translocase subunit SecF, partial [Planctomycetaceae bacterium]|nr:protein translocase subunit SecF [Planctomycetaceae bacterium]